MPQIKRKTQKDGRGIMYSHSLVTLDKELHLQITFSGWAGTACKNPGRDMGRDFDSLFRPVPGQKKIREKKEKNV